MFPLPADSGLAGEDALSYPRTWFILITLYSLSGKSCTAAHPASFVLLLHVYSNRVRLTVVSERNSWGSLVSLQLGSLRDQDHSFLILDAALEVSIFQFAYGFHLGQ